LTSGLIKTDEIRSNEKSGQNLNREVTPVLEKLLRATNRRFSIFCIYLEQQLLAGFLLKAILGLRREIFTAFAIVSTPFTIRRYNLQLNGRSAPLDMLNASPCRGISIAKRFRRFLGDYNR
jgi:hypothetical protein